MILLVLVMPIYVSKMSHFDNQRKHYHQFALRYEGDGIIFKHRRIKTISGNTISKVATGIVISLESAINYTNINVYSNTITLDNTWSGCWGSCILSSEWYHVDGIHTWGNFAGNALGTIKIYGNYYHGRWSFFRMTQHLT